jgi:hypothetical protein
MSNSTPSRNGGERELYVLELWLGPNDVGHYTSLGTLVTLSDAHGSFGGTLQGQDDPSTTTVLLP